MINTMWSCTVQYRLQDDYFGVSEVAVAMINTMWSCTVQMFKE